MKEIFDVTLPYYGDCIPPSIEWSPSSRHLAIANQNLVQIVTRTGKKFHEFRLKSKSAVLACKWDKDGETLAVCQRECQEVALFNVNTKQLTWLETQMKTHSLLIWSKVGPQLAIASERGKVLLYNKETFKRIPIQGRHSKKITCGSWSKENKLALGGLDRIITISDAVGDIEQTAILKGDPTALEFARQKFDETDQAETTISVNLSSKTLLLHDINRPMAPIELAFQRRYGDVTNYIWYGDGYILIVFSEGYIVALSTHSREISEELKQLQVRERDISEVQICDKTQKFVILCQWDVKIGQLNSWRALESFSLEKNRGSGKELSWSKDGKLLTVSTSKGHAITYIVEINLLVACCGNSIAYLSSLQEVTVVDPDNPSDHTVMKLITGEPNLLRISNGFIVASFNHVMWIYNPKDFEKPIQLMFPGAIAQIEVAESTITVLADRKVYIGDITITQQDQLNRISDNKDSHVQSIYLQKDFLFYTSLFSLFQLCVETQEIVNEYKHNQHIKLVASNAPGTRVVFLDDLNKLFLYNPIDSKCIPIEDAPSSISKIMWDTENPYTLYVIDEESKIHTFIYNPITIYGPIIQNAGIAETKGNDEILRITSGKLLSIGKTSHQISKEPLSIMSELNAETSSIKKFNQLLACNRFQEAWNCCRQLSSNGDYMENLIQKCLEAMRIELVIEIYRHQGNAAMVFRLEKLLYTEDLQLLAGHIFLILKEYDRAESKFLASPSPLEALRMRQYLQDWQKAYTLTRQLAPELMHETALQYGQHLEFKGKYTQAIEKFEEAMNGGGALPKHHVDSARGGIARCCLRIGNLMKGTALAKEGSPAQQSECADILEKMKQYETAAELQYTAGNTEKACELYIRASRMNQAKRLIQSITTPKIHAMYAKEMEKRRHYEEALSSYELVNDTMSLIRLYLNHLDRPNDAFALARKVKDAKCAELVADFARSKGDQHAAIEFFIISDQLDRSFEVAKEEGLFPVFGKFLLRQRQHGAFQKYAGQVAEYYESCEDLRLAGHWRLQEGKHEVALDYAIEVEDFDLALDVIEDSLGSPYHTILKNKLHSVLTGHNGGSPRDDIHLYRLHIILGNLDLAAELGRLSASEQLRAGNYRQARKILLEIVLDFGKKGANIPGDVRNLLVLLHSYMLTKILIKKKKHETATKLLLRLVDNISRFERHTVQILTTLVVECKKMKWNHLAHKHASTLMMSQYVSQIPSKFKKTIENIVRRRPQGDAPNVYRDTPCPFCNNPVPDVELECSSCKNQLPMCIISGLHLVAKDQTRCPNCQQYATHSLFIQHLQTNTTCPLCETSIDAQDVHLLETAL